MAPPFEVEVEVEISLALLACICIVVAYLALPVEYSLLPSLAFLRHGWSMEDTDVSRAA